MSVRFPVEMKNNDENVSQRMSNTGHNGIDVLHICFFIIIFPFFIPLFVLLFFLFAPLLAPVYN